MKSTRKLALKRERLTELDRDQLDGLAGGLAVAQIACPTQTCPSQYPCMTLDYKCVETFRTGCCGVTIAG